MRNWFKLLYTQFPYKISFFTMLANVSVKEMRESQKIFSQILHTFILRAFFMELCIGPI